MLTLSTSCGNGLNNYLYLGINIPVEIGMHIYFVCASRIDGEDTFDRDNVRRSHVLVIVFSKSDLDLLLHPQPIRKL